MPFPLDHWKNPRKTIATIFEKNDMAYATHGAIIAMEAIKAMNLLPSEMAEMTLLDYGCGTGRASRVLSHLFKEVHAYDPVKECIDLASKECPGLTFSNVKYYTNINDVPEVDIAVSINVIEHLNAYDAERMIDNLRNKVNGKSYIWHFIKRNLTMLDAYYPTEEMRNEHSQFFRNGHDDRMVITGFNFRD